MKSISFVIPFYNESESIEKTVTVVLSIFKKITDDFELILVNDGSTDDSLPKLLQSFSKESVIQVVSHAKNRGLGAAIRTGFDLAQKEIIIYSDMDMPFDFNLLPELLKNLSHDVDILRGMRATKRESLLRKIYGLGFQLFIFFLFGFFVSDPNFALKIFKRDKLKSLKLTSEGSFIDTEILLQARDCGYKVEIVPVEYKHRQYGASQLANFKNIFLILKEAISYRFNFMNKKSYNNHAQPTQQ